MSPARISRIPVPLIAIHPREVRRLRGHPLHVGGLAFPVRIHTISGREGTQLGRDPILGGQLPAGRFSGSPGHVLISAAFTSLTGRGLAVAVVDFPASFWPGNGTGRTVGSGGGVLSVVGPVETNAHSPHMKCH